MWQCTCSLPTTQFVYQFHFLFIFVFYSFTHHLIKTWWHFLFQFFLWLKFCVCFWILWIQPQVNDMRDDYITHKTHAPNFFFYHIKKFISLNIFFFLVFRVNFFILTSFKIKNWLLILTKNFVNPINKRTKIKK